MTVRLDGIDLVVFDKDGTIIEFGAMWSGWAVALADGPDGDDRAAGGGAALRRCSGSTPRPEPSLPAAGWQRHRWPACATRTRDVLLASGVNEDDAERALEATWHAPTRSDWRDR